MKSVLSTNTIREAENFTINECGIEASVLMERAAVEVAFSVIERINNKDADILIVCGGGNNGADGLCVARILIENGYKPFVYTKESKTDLHSRKLSTLSKIVDCFCDDKYKNDIFVTELNAYGNFDYIVDALYGIGINRPLEETDCNIVDYINKSGAYVISVDIPSGLNSTDGRPMKESVRADETICLGYLKKGLFDNAGPDYAGKVVLKEIGIWHKTSQNDYLLLEAEDIKTTKFVRKTTAHKGTYGKTFVIAGSKDIYGASIFSAKSALYSGAGMVKVVTHENNRHSLEKEIPEALFSFYKDSIDSISLLKDISWSDTVILGPGLGMTDTSVALLETVLFCDKIFNKILIIDADGINIVAKDIKYLDRLSVLCKEHNVKCVITPHKGELERLGKLLEYKGDDLCLKLHEEYSFVVIDKGAHTRIVGDCIYINSTGNDGMATAGSGDVLSGILGGLLFRLKEESFDKACAICVWMHGKSGDIFVADNNAISLTATGIMNAVAKALDFLT